uniref:Uncharacterized protein n=1 Tax=Felis catus TaxID=9685 RepID=A0ABI7XIR8_FELCA
ESRNKSNTCDQFIVDSVPKTVQCSKNSLINKWCQDNWISRSKRRKLLLTSHHKNKQTNKQTTHTQKAKNLKWIKDLNIRAKTIKLLEENLSVNLHDLGFGNGFLRYDNKSTSDNKNDILDFITVNNFKTSKDMIKKVKRQPENGRKYFKSYI